MRVGDLVIHTPEHCQMKSVYEALGDCTAQFSTGLIVDIVYNKKKHCAFACVSSVDIRDMYWYSLDELEVISENR